MAGTSFRKAVSISFLFPGSNDHPLLKTLYIPYVFLTSIAPFLTPF
jgi:hypothetical protein